MKFLPGRQNSNEVPRLLERARAIVDNGFAAAFWMIDKSASELKSIKKGRESEL